MNGKGIVLFVALVCGAVGATAGDAPPVVSLRQGVPCIGAGDRVDSSCAGRSESGDAPYVLRAAGGTTAAWLRDGQPPASDALREVTYSVAGNGKRWPVQTVIEVTDGRTTWQWGLAAVDVRKKQVVRLLPGEYRLAFSAPGHQRREQRLNVTAERARIDLGVIALPASRIVSGAVISPERRPIASCAVLADGIALAFTDARGRFEAELPVPAPRVVTLSHPEFAPRVLPIVSEGDAPFGTVQLSRGGAIACTIDRQKIGAEVKISAKLVQFIAGDTFRQRDTASLAAGGTLLNFTNLDPGDYGIVLEGSSEAEQMVVPVTVAAGAVSEVLVAIAPWRLHLMVSYGDEPLGGAAVRLVNSGTLERRAWYPEIRLDSSGTANLAVWQRGTIWAEVRSENVGAFASPSRWIAIEEDDADWKIVIPRQRVHGIVLDDASGGPVEGARVIHDSDEIGGSWKLTSADGRFSFDALHDGTHTFRVDSPSYLPSEPLSVTIGGVAADQNLEFHLKKGKTIPIEVRDGDGRAAAAAVVIDGCAPASVWRGFRTGTDGSLALPSTGGRHRLCVLPMQGSFALAEIDAPKETSPAPVQIRVPLPQVTMRISAKTTSGLPVAQLGVLLVHNGRVVPPVVVYTIAELQRRFSRTDHRGELLLAGMPAGHYELFVYANDQEAESLAANRRRASPVYSGYLAPGEAALDVTIEERQ